MVPVENVFPSNAYNPLKELWVGYGVVVSLGRVVRVLNLACYLSRRDFLPDSDSLAHISIGLLSERLGLFKARKVSFGDRPSGGGNCVKCFWESFW